ncbi:hypothetical protein H6G96_32600 [Nostoc sp. FACHB-892]|uniref:hypothetical protein n=1 Tax=Nostoc sp. FACHB-892 TaxID=2692843 RepID=UPI001684A18F|nr:hypothetical protein [Nostoc sp. FACHB-892]MBD2730933.1 hypothetical protein [Nostoc sp. FACHB-892]
MAYRGDYKSLSKSEVDSLNQGIRDYYRRCSVDQKRVIRDTLKQTFTVSDRTVNYWLSPNGRLKLVSNSKSMSDERARFAHSLVNQPTHRKGVPTKKQEFTDSMGKNLEVKRFREYLSNKNIWTNLSGKLGLEPFGLYLQYLADSDTEEEELF